MNRALSCAALALVIACAAIAAAQNVTDPCYTEPLNRVGLTLPLTLCPAGATVCANWCWTYAVSEISALLAPNPGSSNSCGAVQPCTLNTELTNYNYYYTDESYNCCSAGCLVRADSISVLYCQNAPTPTTFRYMLGVHNVYAAIAYTDTTTSGGTVITSGLDSSRKQVVTTSHSTATDAGGADAGSANAIQASIEIDPVTGQLNETFLQFELSQHRPVLLGYGTLIAGTVVTDTRFTSGKLVIVYGYDVATVSGNRVVNFITTDPCAGTTVYQTYNQLLTHNNASWTTTFFQLTFNGYCNPTATTTSHANTRTISHAHAHLFTAALAVAGVLITRIASGYRH